MSSRTLGIVGSIAVVLLGGYLMMRSASSRLACNDCNVLIIGVDTLRADRLHHLGYERETTPTLDTLAAKGFSFSKAISASSWTVPSFMSIFTGTFPSVHKVTNKFVTFSESEKKISNMAELAPEIETLATQFKTAGYATGGFTGDAGVSGKFGYRQGFDVYTDETTFGGLENSAGHALTWIDSLGGKKFFMFFHGYDLHGQFKEVAGYRGRFVPKDYRGPFNGSGAQEAKLREDQLTPKGISLSTADVDFWNGFYDSKIRDADDRLKAFLDALDKKGVLQKTIIVVVSDHGEEFYEHKGFDHGQSLYDELVHVPLIIVSPKLQKTGIIDRQISMIDVAPTVLELAGVHASTAFTQQMRHAQSLVPALDGRNIAEQDAYLETDYRNFTHKRAIRTNNDWKYIRTMETGAEELYNLASDPHERTNLASSTPQKLASLRAALFKHLKDDLSVNPDQAWTIGCLPVYDGECK